MTEREKAILASASRVMTGYNKAFTDVHLKTCEMILNKDRESYTTLEVVFLLMGNMEEIVKEINNVFEKEKQTMEIMFSDEGVYN